MATNQGISIEQYLKTGYTPDCEYIHGRLKERSAVDFHHGVMLAILSSWFQNHARPWRIHAAVGTRTRVAENIVRLPDFVIVSPGASAPDGALETPPLIAIEVLSPTDSYADLQQRARDLHTMGTANIWLIDPSERTIALWDGDTWQPFKGDKLQATGTAAYLDLLWLWSKFA